MRESGRSESAERGGGVRVRSEREWEERERSEKVKREGGVRVGREVRDLGERGGVRESGKRGSEIKERGGVRLG